MSRIVSFTRKATYNQFEFKNDSNLILIQNVTFGANIQAIGWKTRSLPKHVLDVAVIKLEKAD